ncbi:hypothetical protein L596_020613 [Steinernema carpocapsae]|uniref:Saposin B-type domain-containing protein n=1 Tax=Steinernema carpocapsae TaxID=34508 RepID=A0A4V6A0Y3_STECR|nr:hypothetical protein L596_020613 [Steinernema carpocapsae]
MKDRSHNSEAFAYQRSTVKRLLVVFLIFALVLTAESSASEEYLLCDQCTRVVGHLKALPHDSNANWRTLFDDMCVASRWLGSDFCWYVDHFNAWPVLDNSLKNYDNVKRICTTIYQWL